MLATLGGTGCQSSGPRDSKACEIAPGMTTRELAECQCFNPSQRGSGATVSSGSGSISISIVNYFCPRNGGGFATVTVRNGVVSEVFD